MIPSIKIAPLAPTQIPVPATPAPQSPAPPKLDRLDQFIVDFVRESEPVKTCQALNAAAQELTPRTRAEGREARLRLLPRVLRLLRLGFLFRLRAASYGACVQSPVPAGNVYIGSAAKSRNLGEAATCLIVNNETIIVSDWAEGCVAAKPR